MNRFHQLGAIVERWSHEFPPGSETDFNDSLGGAWYISPTHHAIEFLTLAPLYVGLVLWLGYRLLSSKQFYPLLAADPPKQKASFVERSLFWLMLASLSVTVIHKAATSTLLFLMQPCHASAALLILVMGWPDHKSQLIPRILFNVYLHTMWGAILALVFPDLRDHDMPGEVFNFYFEHILVLVLPFYMILSKRYVVLPPSVPMALFSFFLYAAYHSPVLHVMSLTSGFNLNYVLVPPTLTFLIAVGPWYRCIMYLAALALMFITRFGLVETFIYNTQRIRLWIIKKNKAL